MLILVPSLSSFPIEFERRSQVIRFRCAQTGQRRRFLYHYADVDRTPANARMLVDVIEYVKTMTLALA